MNVNVLLDALEIISKPIVYFQNKAKEEGCQLDGVAAIQLSKDGNWLSGIATQALADYKKDLEPEVQSLDVDSVALHSCTSTNSIEQEAEKYFKDAETEANLMGNFLFPDKQNVINAFIMGVKFIINQGEGSQRSVASKDAQGDDAGNINSIENQKQ